jgi:hypothetical protein
MKSTNDGNWYPGKQGVTIKTDKFVDFIPKWTQLAAELGVGRYKAIIDENVGWMYGDQQIDPNR